MTAPDKFAKTPIKALADQGPSIHDHEVLDCFGGFAASQ
jgi:hypothetical protein